MKVIVTSQVDFEQKMIDSEKYSPVARPANIFLTYLMRNISCNHWISVRHFIFYFPVTVFQSPLTKC